MLLRCYFYIIDNEYGGEYSYIGHFESRDEAARFIQENKDAGNEVIIIAPYYQLVPADSVDLNAL